MLQVEGTRNKYLSFSYTLVTRAEYSLVPTDDPDALLHMLWTVPGGNRKQRAIIDETSGGNNGRDPAAAGQSSAIDGRAMAGARTKQSNVCSNGRGPAGARERAADRKQRASYSAWTAMDGTRRQQRAINQRCGRAMGGAQREQGANSRKTQDASRTQ